MWATQRVCRTTLNIIQVVVFSSYSVLFIQWLFSRNFMRFDKKLNYALRLCLYRFSCRLAIVVCARLTIKKNTAWRKKYLRIFCRMRNTSTNLCSIHTAGMFRMVFILEIVALQQCLLYLFWITIIWLIKWMTN